MFVGIVFNILTVLTSNYYYQSIFSMINQLQVIMLLPLTGGWFPEVFLDFNRMVKFTLFSFSEFTEYVMSPIFTAGSWDFDQDNSYLNLIGIISGSTMYNILGVIGFVFILMIVHATFYCFNDLTMEKKGDTKFLRLSHLMANYLTFSAYIRLFCLCYIFLFISSYTEMRRLVNRTEHSDSYFFACLVLLGIIGLTVMIYIKTLKMPNETEASTAKYTKELFNCIKQNKLARSYFPVFLTRRALLVLIALTFTGGSQTIKLIAFSLIQLAYFGYMVAARPFTRIKDNIGEIMNEGFYLLFIGLLFLELGNKDWNDTTSLVFMICILVNNILFTCVALGKHLFLIY